MISISQAKKYCREDISLIKNYADAVADTTQEWICHHINGEPCTGFNAADLIKMNMYTNRPAAELMFVTRKMHEDIHKNGKSTRFGTSKGYSNKGKHLSESHKSKISIAQKGKPRLYMRGMKWKQINGKRVYYRLDEVTNA